MHDETPHFLPHAPQFAGSEVVFAQVDPHIVLGGAHVVAASVPPSSPASDPVTGGVTVDVPPPHATTASTEHTSPLKIRMRGRLPRGRDASKSCRVRAT